MKQDHQQQITVNDSRKKDRHLSQNCKHRQ